MHRDGRLAIGALLTALAGFLVFIHDQAKDKTAANVIIALFAVPGLLLLASGIRPGPTIAGQTRMLFVPARLATGLAVSLAGIAVVFVRNLLHVFPESLLVGALLAVPAGLLYAASCWTEACANCSAPLEDYRARFNAASARALEAAVSSASLSKILELRRARPTGSRVVVLIRFCPRCRRVGLLHGPGQARVALIADQVTRLLNGIFASRQPDETAAKLGW
jgi:hypothetical protein